jgi:hypothetical protein
MAMNDRAGMDDSSGFSSPRIAMLMGVNGKELAPHADKSS